MRKRVLWIGKWLVEFYFCMGGYDEDELLDRLYQFGAAPDTLKRVASLMESGHENTGFSFTNPNDRLAVIAIGPQSDGSEFVNTLSHEIHHLAVAVADELGLDLTSEPPAYLAGDTLQALVSDVCRLGCGCKQYT